MARTNGRAKRTNGKPGLKQKIKVDKTYISKVSLQSLVVVVDLALHSYSMMKCQYSDKLWRNKRKKHSEVPILRQTEKKPAKKTHNKMIIQRQTVKEQVEKSIIKCQQRQMVKKQAENKL